MTHDAWSDDNAENMDDDDVLKLDLSAVVIDTVTKKTSKATTSYYSRVESSTFCGATKHFWSTQRQI